MRPPIQDKFFLESILIVILIPLAREKNLESFSESHSAETKSEASREACPEQSRRPQYDSAVQGYLIASLHYRASVHLCTGCQLISSPLFGFFGDFENNLAARVTSRDLFLGLNRFRKRKRLRHNHFDFLLVD
jgi:hypothetical protein